MQDWLIRAAEELSVRIVVGYAVTLADGRKLESQALFPDFGGPIGTLVFRFDDPIDKAARREIAAQGFGASTLSEPGPGEEFDIGNYAEMLSEWGWTSADAAKPAWME